LIVLTFLILIRTGRPRDENRLINRIELEALANVLEHYKRDCGMYPLTESGLEGLVKKSASLTCPQYRANGYLQKPPKDSYEQSMSYLSDGLRFEIRTSDGEAIRSP
jgi:hypothetical protein